LHADISQVIGSAIALNLLLKIPLVAGCALTIVDTLLILFLYSPNGSMRRIRAFELFVMALVLAVVVCFCIQLSYITDTSVGEVFKGYLPSSAVVDGDGLYLSCGILGATVMPHSLYLGSGMCQSRLRAFDEQAGLHISNPTTSVRPSKPGVIRRLFTASMNTQNLNRTLTRNITPDPTPDDDPDQPSEKVPYRPSLAAIRSCLSYSITELALSLCIFALFVNSAILIVAGASLSNNADGPPSDLFGIYTLLSSSLAPAAGTVFALALLLSGTSAGIICTIAGQMVSEGALNWTIAPWARRLLTRSISIVPSIVIAGAVGSEGLSKALNGTQVALSVILPFVSAPLVYFTCRNRYMTVRGTGEGSGEGAVRPGEGGVGMRNHWIMIVLAVAVWLTITIMNVALLVILGLGK
jgi:metal iron transporter